MGSINRELFEELPVPVAARKLMVPTILSSLVMIIYSLADTYFVGLLNNEFQSAAVSLAAPALLAFNAVNNLFGVGSSSLMSRALGQQDVKTVRQGASIGFYGAVVSGALLSLLCLAFFPPLLRLLGAKADTMQATADYMLWAVVCGAVPSILNVVMAYLVRSEGASLHASVGTMSGCVLNILLDPLFILPWGLNMGAAGAGLATFISNCAACGYFFVLLAVRRDKTNIRLHPKYFKPRKNLVLGIFGVGIPAAIQNLLNVTGMTVLNNFVAGYGPAAMAAIGIAQKIDLVPKQIALGGTQGIMPLVSYSYTNRRSDRFSGAIGFIAKLMLPCMVVVAILSWIFAAPLMRLFIENPEIVDYGRLFLRGLVASIPFMFLDFLVVGVFQSIGMGGKSLLFAILRKIVLEIPAIFLLNWLFGAAGITYAGFVAELVLAVYGSFLLTRIIRDAKARD